jgi:hypothetical protein
MLLINVIFGVDQHQAVTGNRMGGKKKKTKKSLIYPVPRGLYCQHDLIKLEI